MKERGFLLTMIFFFSIILPGIAPEAGAQGDPFYKGKTIRIMVGSTAGRFYDRWGRLFGKYMGKYIPGQPEIIVQNVTGAGSVIAANQVYNVAKPEELEALVKENLRLAAESRRAGEEDSCQLAGSEIRGESGLSVFARTTMRIDSVLRN